MLGRKGQNKKRYRDRRQGRRVPGRQAEDTPVFMEYIYVPGASLSLYTVSSDDGPTGWEYLHLFYR